MNNMCTPTAEPDAQVSKSVLAQKWLDRTVVDVPEVAEILRTNTWTIYEAIKRGEIRAVKIGRVLRITRPVLEEILSP
jgi:excisionase family DNA binding protein